MIWSVGQGIRSTEIFSWDVFESEVELRQVKQPLSLAAVQVVRLAEVSKIFVVRKDLNRGGGTK